VTKRKQTVLRFLAVLLLGFVLGVWVAWPNPRTPVERMRDTVRAQAEDTDAWLAELDRDLAEPSGTTRER
jgi:hypothetical protein